MLKRKVNYQKSEKKIPEPIKEEKNILSKDDMNQESIKKWMEENVSKKGFVNATTLAENFFKEHHITDALDPVFSLGLDVAFAVATDIHDKKMQGTV